MAPITPEEQAILDALDASVEPVCVVKTGPHPAEVALRCKSCGQAVALICRHHAQVYAAYQLKMSLEALAEGQVWTIHCVRCHKTVEHLDDLIEVVNL